MPKYDISRLTIAITGSTGGLGSALAKVLVNGSEEPFSRVIDINLNGVWRTFKAAIPHVQKRKGYLLAISSMAAFIHSPLQSSYAASKVVEVLGFRDSEIEKAVTAAGRR